jgi:murein DD-endopeptidase MepM/ murein hydrolase activator NlpD
MTGYLPADLIEKVEDGMLSPETAIVTKPFTAAGLLAKVREVLDGIALSAATQRLPVRAPADGMVNGRPHG